MDYKFLNKVVDHIVRETIIDYVWEEIQFPFSSRPYPTPLSLIYNFPSSLFHKHCRGVYGLNDDEVKYVWKQYKRIIKDKIDG